VDIGIAGPLGGLVVTIPVTLIGLWLTSLGDPSSGIVGDEGAIAIMIQPLYALLALFIPLAENVPLHPTAFAAWVGFLVTAINLLPAGQLDGGHVARGLLGDKSKYLSYATVVMLLVLGLFYTGWLIFALLIVFLGLKHPAPLNDVSKLDGKRKALGALTLAILLITFSPIPLMEITPDHSFTIDVPGGNETTIIAGSSTYFIMYINNTGNTNLNITMDVMQVPNDWSASLYLQGHSGDNSTDLLEIVIPYDNGTVVVLKVTIPMDEDNISRELLVETVSLTAQGATYLTDEQTFIIRVE
ncbi:MAG: site-2 protease family protein, partial [Methanomassiliicoccales archaeon]|nr:site-2 protease family protein [Methanomassiliicoccales archaeon]